VGTGAVTSQSLAWRVEETELNAWPALREVYLSGWLLRFSGGRVSRRANSVNPLTLDSRGDDALIAVCEGYYRRNELPTIFRIVSLLDPGLDARLHARGYTAEGQSRTIYGAIDQIPAVPDRQVTLLPRPTARWSAAMSVLQGHTAAQAGTYRRMLSRIAVPARFAMLTVDGAPTALAYAAFHAGLFCYESVITDPALRRRGYTRRVLGALAAWAKAEGAIGACLQVQADNAPALPLYHSIGLTTELYRYHYRRGPS